MSIPGVFFEFTSWTSWSMKQHLQGLWSDGNAIKCKDKYKFSSPKSISVAHKNRWRSLYLDTSDKHGEPFSFLFNALGFLGQGLSMIIRWGSFTRSFPIHINKMGRGFNGKGRLQKQYISIFKDIKNNFFGEKRLGV